MDHEQAGEAAVGKGLVLTLVPTTHTYKTWGQGSTMQTPSG